MAVSRYSSTPILTNNHYGTTRLPTKVQMDSIPSISVRVGNADRLDLLAAQYLGDSKYWWIIALMNDIEWAFTFDDGQIIKIPLSANDFLRFVV